MEKEFNPFVSLAMSMIFGAGEGGEVPDGKADSVPASNKKWHEKYQTNINLEDLEDSAWDASYFSILDTIRADSEATYKDVMVPYSADDYAVFYAEENGNYYFWLPLDGMRLKVYEDNGIAKFDSMKVDEFSLSEDVSSLSNEVNNIQNQADGIEYDVDALNERVFHGKVVYGFHIDSTESDPYQCVTYLEDAVNMIPAHMDFANDRFDYGTWENAFFMPRPCMLKYDGTVDYYLDPNDYSKKEDGTPSDVASESYWGNAMMEWGRYGRKIWYKIVPDSDPTSASVYIASYRVDDGYHAWSFVNNQGELVDHFYTPIYNGSIDSSGRLRSISGKTYSDICQSKTVAQEVTAAELNNLSSDKLWYTEVYSDITMINLLLILMGKSLNTQATFGNGVQGQASAATSMISTGTMDSKGLFWGDDDNTHGVKIFGVENWWGNQNRRFAGLVMVDRATKYKMTKGTEDGSTATDYNTDGTGYIAGNTAPSSNNFVKKMQFNTKGFLPNEVGGTASTYWGDYFYQNTGTRYALTGGSAATTANNPGAFCVSMQQPSSYSTWLCGASPSCKPSTAKNMVLGYSPIVYFRHDEGYALSSLKSKIVPVQSGSGDPYPPGGGKNKCSVESYTLEKPDQRAKSIIIDPIPAGTYTISWTSANSVLTRLQGYDENNTQILNTVLTTASGSSTFKISVALVRLYVYISVSEPDGVTASISNLQIESGSSATAYAPYSNVRPISGFTGINVKVAGTNLAPSSVPSNVIAGTFTTSSSKIDSASNARVFAFRVPKNTNLYVQKKSGDATGHSVALGDTGTIAVNTPIYSPQGLTNSLGFSINTGEHEWMYVQSSTLAVAESLFTTSEFMVGIGSSRQEYTPSVGGNTYSVSFESAGTVYGGVVDVVSGTLTVDKAMAIFDGSNDETWIISYSDKYRAAISISDAVTGGYNWDLTGNYIVSTGRAVSYPDAWKAIINSVGSLVIGIPDDLHETATWESFLAETPLAVVYPLATPIVYQLTPTEVTTLIQNNIWSDTGDVEVTYPLITK